MSEAVRSTPAEQLSPYEAVLRSFGYFERVTPEELAVARAGLELAVGRRRGMPMPGRCWRCCASRSTRKASTPSLIPSARGPGRAACGRGRALQPLLSFALAQALFFRKEFETFRNAAERAVALNPMDGTPSRFSVSCWPSRATGSAAALGERARDLNPHHPEWYWALPFLDAYRKGDYRGARAFMPKANMPGSLTAGVVRRSLRAAR